MRRDFDVARRALLQAEAATSELIFVRGTDEESRALFYNLKVLIDTGYLEGVPASTTREERVRVVGLTYKGHEFLDAVRADQTWALIKSKLPIDTHEMPFHLVEQYAFHLAAQKVTTMSP